MRMIDLFDTKIHVGEEEGRFISIPDQRLGLAYSEGHMKTPHVYFSMFHRNHLRYRDITKTILGDLDECVYFANLVVERLEDRPMWERAYATLEHACTHAWNTLTGTPSTDKLLPEFQDRHERYRTLDLLTETSAYGKDLMKGATLEPICELLEEITFIHKRLRKGQAHLFELYQEMEEKRKYFTRL
jgi:hypothetical protein